MKYIFGSVSSGTHVSQELLTAYADALEKLLNDNSEYDDLIQRELITEARDLVGDVKGWDEENYRDTVHFVLAELTENLDLMAPPYFYFGAHADDGADYGFWLSEDVPQNVRANDGLVVEDLCDVPDGYHGEVLQISDHGNMTLYGAHGSGLTEIWSVV